MPGQLRRDAWCPVCGREIVVISRTTRHRWGRTRVELEFDHQDTNVLSHSIIGDEMTMDRIHDRLTEVPKPPPGTGRKFFGK